MLYRELEEGVINTLTGEVAHPIRFPARWREYQNWRRAGNLPDPYIAPTQPPETLAQAKYRRAVEIRKEGLARMQTRFTSLQSFDAVQLVRETILSIAPAARQLTADMTWLSQTYDAGKTAIGLVQAATTIAQVDAVIPAWPAL